MKRCYNCERGEDIVNLLDAIDSGEIVKICEECAFVENVPVIRKPSSEQIEKSQLPYSVANRMRKTTGVGENKKEDIKKITENIYMRAAEKSSKEQFNGRVEMAKKNNQPLNLVDNYNWAVMMERKKRRIDRKQLADAIGEKETAIKLIETKELPGDALKIINKLEQYLGLKLRKESQQAAVSSSAAVVLKMDKEAVKNFTLDDLRKLKKEKERIAGEDAQEPIKEENINELIDVKQKKGLFSKIKDWLNKEEIVEGAKENTLDSQEELLEESNPKI